MTESPEFHYFASDKIDFRSRASLTRYLASHATHRDWYEEPKFANSVKLSWGGILHVIPRELQDRAFALIADEYPPYRFEIEALFDDFAAAHPGARIVVEGRSGGWLALEFTPAIFEFVGSPSSVDTYSAQLWSFAELRRVARTVRAFDETCDQAVTIFLAYAADPEFAEYAE